MRSSRSQAKINDEKLHSNHPGSRLSATLACIDPMEFFLKRFQGHPKRNENVAQFLGNAEQRFQMPREAAQIPDPVLQARPGMLKGRLKETASRTKKVPIKFVIRETL